MLSNPKIKYIFRPFLILTVSFVVGYNLLCWLLIVQFRVDVKQHVSHIIVPFIVALPLAYFCLRSRVGILKYDSEKTARLLYVFASLCMVIPTFIGLEYVDKATGKLVFIEKISDHEHLKPEKFYLLKYFHADQSKITYSSESHTSGKRRRRKYSIDINIAVPMLDKAADSIFSLREKKYCAGWLAFQFSTTMSDHVSSLEKQMAYQTLVRQSLRFVHTGDLSGFRYLEREGNTMLRETFAATARTNGFYYSEAPAIFFPVHEPFKERTEDLAGWFFGVLFGGILIFGVLVLIPKVDKQALRRFEGGRMMVWRRKL